MPDIAETKNPGKPCQLPAASEAELLLSLRQAIEARDIADGHARDAKEVADKADHLSRQAANEAQKLRAILDDTNDRAL